MILQDLIGYIKTPHFPKKFPQTTAGYLKSHIYEAYLVK